MRRPCPLRTEEPKTPRQFIAKWKRAELSERSAYQQHFLDLCELLDQPKPAEVDPRGEWFTFEKGGRHHRWRQGVGRRLPDHQFITFAFAADYHFGVLHS